MRRGLIALLLLVALNASHVVAIAAAILPIVWFVGRVVTESRLPYPNYSIPFNNAFGRWMSAAGPMILGAWIALALQARWRPSTTWMDRAGCVLGGCFVVVYLYAEIYFAVIV